MKRTRLLLVAGLVALVGCGSSEDGKKDAGPALLDAGQGPLDAGQTADAVARDLGTADCGTDCFPQDLAGIDVPGPFLDAAPDWSTDGPGPATDARPEDVPPDVQPDAAPPDTAGPDSASDLSPDTALAPDTAADAVAMCGRIKCDCTFSKNGKTFKLYGKYKVDNVFPDIKVRVVSVFEDLKVRKVNVFADACGKWQEVDVFPDFTVQFVDVFEDFSVRYVDVFEGIP